MGEGIGRRGAVMRLVSGVEVVSVVGGGRLIGMNRDLGFFLKREEGHEGVRGVVGAGGCIKRRGREKGGGGGDTLAPRPPPPPRGCFCSFFPPPPPPRHSCV